MEPYFHLKGSYKTSADATKAQAEIEKFIEESKTTILQKGVAAGRGAKIISWKYARTAYSLILNQTDIFAP